MKAKYLVTVFVLVALVGCQEDEVPPPELEVFTGELAVADIKQKPKYKYHDTGRVIFTVEGGTYKLDHSTDVRNFCSSRGKVTGFGTNTLRLTPTFFDYSQACDSLKVPQGEFKAVFRGDSLYLGPDTQVFMTEDINTKYIDTMIYHFRLTQ